MTVSSRRPLIDEDGEVREITLEDMKNARRGRPPMPSEERKRRVNLMLEPQVIEALKARGVMSAEANKLLKEALGL